MGIITISVGNKETTKEALRISSYSVRMRENTGQKNIECGHFSRSQVQNMKFWIIFSS